MELHIPYKGPVIRIQITKKDCAQESFTLRNVIVPTVKAFIEDLFSREQVPSLGIKYVATVRIKLVKEGELKKDECISIPYFSPKQIKVMMIDAITNGAFTEIHPISEHTIKEIAWIAWNCATNAHRMYPNNKHTFADHWDHIKKEIEDLKTIS